MNAICLPWMFMYGWWAKFFLVWNYFYYAIFYNARSHKNATYHIVAELTVLKILSICTSTDPWVSNQSSSFQDTLCEYMFLKCVSVAALNLCTVSFKLQVVRSLVSNWIYDWIRSMRWSTLPLHKVFNILLRYEFCK